MSKIVAMAKPSKGFSSLGWRLQPVLREQPPLHKLRRTLNDLNISYYSANSDGFLHRTDAAAIVTRSGYKEWWVNGILHRVNGPALEKSGYFDEDFYAVFNKISLHTAECEQSISSTATTDVLDELVRNDDSVVAYLASQNPNCSTESKIEYSLLRSSDFSENGAIA